MDRGCITYSIVYITGILLAKNLHASFALCAALMLPLIVLSLYTRKETGIFLIVTHLAFFCSGICSYTLAKEKEDMLPCNISVIVQEKAFAAQEKASAHFRRFVPAEDSHSILCALTIGKKGYIEKDLKAAYSSAGAMHILALSGLHVGIIYSIIQTIMVPLSFLPAAKWIKGSVSLLFIFIYCIFSGCSPSVVRACTMIFIYKIAESTFRNTGKWEAIALSALAIGIIAPLQVWSIGFQLSYAAVTGIALLYPPCREAFLQIWNPHKKSLRFLHSITLKIWESISISVCCQITTLPLLLLYFGESAQYFIITNLIAIPLATAILHVFALLLLFQWIPFVDNMLIYCLNFLIETMNKAIIFISS